MPLGLAQMTAMPYSKAEPVSSATPPAKLQAQSCLEAAILLLQAEHSSDWEQGPQNGVSVSTVSFPRMQGLSGEEEAARAEREPGQNVGVSPMATHTPQCSLPLGCWLLLHPHFPLHQREQKVGANSQGD